MFDDNPAETTLEEDTTNIKAYQDNIVNEDLALHTQESRILGLGLPLVNQEALSLNPDELKEYLGFVQRITHIFDDPMPPSVFLNQAEKEKFETLELQVAQRTKTLADMLETKKTLSNGQASDITTEDLLPYGYKLGSGGNIVIATNEDIIPKGYFLIPAKEDDGTSLRMMPKELVSKRDLSKAGYTRNKAGEIYKYIQNL